MTSGLEELQHEDRLRDIVSDSIRKRLAPALQKLSDELARKDLAQRLQDTRRRIEDALSLFGGHSLESQEDFQQALNNWIEHQTRGGLRVFWQKIGPWPEWSKTECLDALCILCEACSNARRHGRASEIRILVRGWADGFSVTIEDNGSGFPEEMTGNGAGLNTMRMRANRAGAQFFSANRSPRGALIGWSREPGSKTPELNEGETAPLGKRLGMELHDDFCQRLVGILVELELLRDELPEQDSHDWLRLKEAEDQLRKAHETIRKWSHELIETNDLTAA